MFATVFKKHACIYVNLAMKMWKFETFIRLYVGTGGIYLEIFILLVCEIDTVHTVVKNVSILLAINAKNVDGIYQRNTLRARNYIKQIENQMVLSANENELVSKKNCQNEFSFYEINRLPGKC